MTALSEAIKEAYASAPAGVVLLHSLEIRHPAFVDDNGNPTAIRVVSDHVDHMFTLEDTAPLQAGETVLFNSFAFNLTLPAISDKITPQLTMTIDNVSREMVRHIESAVDSQEIIMMTYRPYLSTDKSRPHYDPPLHLVLRDIVVDIFKVSGKASFGDLTDKTFPSDLYTPERFPGLVR